MIIILDTMQYRIETDRDLNLGQEWKDFVAKVLWSKSLYFRELTRKGDVWWWDAGLLQGFAKRFDSFRDYHELTFIFLQELEAKYQTSFKIINTGVQYQQQ